MDFFTFDDDYLRRLREGDRWTEEHFHSYFQELLLLKLQGRLRSKQAIEDACQEVFTRFFSQLRSPNGGIRDATRLGSYMVTICKNRLFELYREDKRTEPLEDEHLHTLITGENFELDFIKGEQAQHVRRVLDELSMKDRRILLALFFEERPKDDICRDFGVDRAYLRVLLHRAKEKFRDAWEKPLPFRPDETDPDKPSLPIERQVRETDQ